MSGSNLLIQVEDSVDSAANSLLGNVSSLFDVKSTTDAEIELIRSRLVISRAVDSTKLFIYAKPRYLPLLGLRIASRNKKLSKPGIFGIGGFCWGSESIDVSQFDVPSYDEGDKFKITALERGRYMLSGSDLERPVIGFVGKLLTFQTDVGEATLLVDNMVGNSGAEFNLVRHSRLKTIESIQDKLKLQELGKQSGVNCDVLCVEFCCIAKSCY